MTRTLTLAKVWLGAGAAALLVLHGAGRLAAQTPANATLRAAVQAYDNLNIGQAITLAARALRERLTAAEQARAYELLGFSYSALDSSTKAVDAFKNELLLDPNRELDPQRVSPKIRVYFGVALSQLLVVRQPQVDSATFVGGRGTVPIRYTVTSPARVTVRAVGAGLSVPIDSTVANGSVNLRWRAQLPNGDPVPAGDYVILVEAVAGQTSFSASQPVRVRHGSVDTLSHLASLPGYDYLSETEIPPQTWGPLGLAFLYTGAALAGTLGLESSSLGSSSKREIGIIGGAALVTGFVMTLRKPAPRPAEGNILYNKLLREQIARRNDEIAKENIIRRQQVQLTIVPVPKATGGR